MRYGLLDYLTTLEVEREVLGYEAEIECFNRQVESDLPAKIGELDAVMVGHMLHVGTETINRLKNCRVIVRVGVGYDNIDVKAAGRAGIPVVNIPDYGTNEVADHTLAMLLSLCRGLPRFHEALVSDPSGAWNTAVGGYIRRITNTTLGIVGIGRIGTAVAIRAKAFGINVEYYDPYATASMDKVLQIRRVGSLEELVESSNYVSIHAPLTLQTHGMFCDQIFERARPGFILINTARGEIVSLDALARALTTGNLLAFGADVLECEPPDVNHPLIRQFMSKVPSVVGRVLITPHAAYYAEESRREMRLKAAKQMLAAVTAVPLRNCVNFEYLRAARAVVIPQLPAAWTLDQSDDVYTRG